MNYKIVEQYRSPYIELLDPMVPLCDMKGKTVECINYIDEETLFFKFTDGSVSLLWLEDNEPITKFGYGSLSLYRSIFTLEELNDIVDKCQNMRKELEKTQRQDRIAELEKTLETLKAEVLQDLAH